MEAFDAFIVVFASGMRLAIPLILACLAGLWSERSGVVDIGLEGKILVGAFASAAGATFTGSAWIGLALGVASTIVFSLIHGYASIDQRANQIVSGTAINMVADGLTALIGNAIWQQGGRSPQLPAEAQFHAIQWPFEQEIGRIPIVGSIYDRLISGSDVITYVAFLMVPLTYWALYSTRFGLRLRAVGENPAAVDTAGISVRALRYSAVVICGVLVGLAGVYLALGADRLFPAAHVGGARLHRARRARLRQMAALAGARDLSAVRLSRRGRDPPAGRRTPRHRPGSGAGDRGLALCSDGRAACRIHRQGDPAESFGDSLCQGALNRSRTCSRRRGPHKRTPMRPIRASGSARRLRPPDGAIFAGGNVENAAYPEGVCAETSAISAMTQAGERRIVEICVVGDGEALCTPCGGCRQRIREFADAATLVHVAGPEGVRRTFTLADLLPESFGPGHLPA